MRPGWTGGLFLSLMIHLSMVILVIYSEDIPLFEDKGNAPIAGNLHGPSTLLLGLKEMESRTRETHVPDFPGLVQAVKDFFQLSGVLGLNYFLAPIVKEIFQPFMQERLDHRNIVTRLVTLVKGFCGGVKRVRGKIGQGVAYTQKRVSWGNEFR